MNWLYAKFAKSGLRRKSLAANMVLSIGTYLIVHLHACKVLSYVQGGYQVRWLKSDMESRITFELAEAKDSIAIKDVNLWNNFIKTNEAKQRYSLSALEAFASCVELINRDMEKKDSEAVV